MIGLWVPSLGILNKRFSNPRPCSAAEYGGGGDAVQYSEHRISQKLYRITEKLPEIRNSLWLDDLVANGVAHQVAERLELQLSHDGSPMGLRRFHADAKGIGHFLVALSLREQLHNLALAIGNLIPLYQLDGWKGGMVIVRSMFGRKSPLVEWMLTLGGGAIALAIFVRAFLNL